MASRVEDLRVSTVVCSALPNNDATTYDPVKNEQTEHADCVIQFERESPAAKLAMVRCVLYRPSFMIGGVWSRNK